MKIFCQKCGNGLPAHALICPKCGFENKIVDGKLNFFKFTIFILAILFIAGGFYFYRGEIVSYYKKVKIENGRIAIDVDAGNKDEFKKGFESYVFESRNFLKSSGFLFDKVNDDIKNAYSERDKKTAEMNDKNCYLNNNDECKKIKIDVEDINTKIEKFIAYELGLGKFCGMDGEEQNRKCEEYQKNTLDYPNQDCNECESDIQNLYKAASGFTNKDTAANLISLVDMLRAHQTGFLEYEKVSADLWSKQYCQNAQLENQRILKSMSESDIQKEVTNERSHLRGASVILKISGQVINKQNLLSYSKRTQESCQQDVWDMMDQVSKSEGELNGVITKINDYISILNGDMKLELSHLDKI